MLATVDSGSGPMYMVNDIISGMSTQDVTIADDAISFSEAPDQ